MLVDLGAGEATVASEGETRACPACGEAILAVARRCRHCGEAIRPPEPPLPAFVKAERSAAIDVLRGLAILGILPVNLPSFALPMALTDVTYAVSAAASEAAVQGALYALIDFKLISVFALLFGLGLELQAFGRPDPTRTWTARALHARWAVLPRMLRRMLALGGLGLIHAWFLWYGDILFTYGLVGAAAVFALTATVRWQPLVALGLAALAVPTTLSLGSGLLVAAGLLPPDFLSSPPAGPTTVADALAAPDVGNWVEGSPAPGREILLHRERGVGGLMELRIVTWVQMCFLICVYYGWRVFGLMMLGAAAVRAGLLRPDERQRRGLLRFVAWALPIGLAVESLRAWVEVTGDVRQPASGLLEGAHQLSSLAVALSFAAIAVLVPARWHARAPLRWFAAAGRMSLSCYLAETAVCLLVFDGLGWFAHLTRVQLLLFAVGVWCALLLAAGAWGRVFVTGPVEWVWRTIADGVTPPLRRAPA